MRKIKKVLTLLNEAKEEHADKEHEYQREMEALLDNYRLLVRELQLANMMIDNYIPKEYLVRKLGVFKNFIIVQINFRKKSRHICYGILRQQNFK